MNKLPVAPNLLNLIETFSIDYDHSFESFLIPTVRFVVLIVRFVFLKFFLEKLNFAVLGNCRRDVCNQEHSEANERNNETRFSVSEVFRCQNQLK